MSRIWAVARHMTAESIRSKIALPFIVGLVILLAVLPFKAVGDGLTLKSRVQTYLSWSLGVVGFALSVLTVLLSCSTLASEIREKHARTFNVRAGDPAGLVVAWLAELLFAFDVDGWVFARFAVRTEADVALDAVGYGETADLERHVLGTAVKAVTYHELDVRLEPGKAQMRVILDL